MSDGMTVRDLAEIADIRSFNISPDGRYAVFQIYRPDIEANRYDIGWYSLALSNAPRRVAAQPVRLADGGEPAFFMRGVAGGGINGQFADSALAWAPDGRQFAFIGRSQGSADLYLSSVTAPGQRKLTHGQADVIDLAWSRDGARIFFSLARPHAELAAERAAQLRNGALIPPGADAIDLEMPALPACTGAIVGRCMPTIRIWDLATQTERAATAAELTEFEALTAAGAPGEQRPLLARAGNLSAWVENPDPAKFNGVLPPMRLTADIGGRRISCNAAVCTSPAYWGLWLDEQEIIALLQTGRADSVQSLIRWNPLTGRVRSVLGGEDLLSNCQRAGRTLYCLRESWLRPKHIVAIDSRDGRATELYDPNFRFAKANRLLIEKHIWPDAFGNDAVAHLVFPTDYRRGKRYPLIITTYHTGGFLRGATGDEQPIPLFARNGFFVLSFAPSRDQAAWTMAGETTPNPDIYDYILFKRGPQSAIEAKINALARRGLIDPARVGLTAFSYGGNLLDEMLVSTRRIAAASAGWSPISPALGALRPRDPTTEKLYGGDQYTGGLENWKRISIAFNAEKVTAPLLIQAADREILFSLQNFMALKQADRPVELIRFADEYHVKWQPAHRFAVYTRNLDWFNFWLRGQENSDLDKQSQNKRWRLLKIQACKSLRSAPAYC